MINLANKPTRTMLAMIAPQVVIALIVVYAGRSDSHYFKAIPEKYQIASEQESPKIVLAGGSSVAWGSDSEAFSIAYDQRCVNLGLNAGQGLAFRLAEAANFCHSGDSLILSLEYNELSTKPYGDIIAKTVLYSPSSLAFLHRAEWKAMLDDGVLEILAGLARSTVDKLMNQADEEPLYRNDNFNCHGDFIGHKDQHSEKPPDFTLTVWPAATTYLNMLKTFDLECQAKGVTVFYRLPCLPKSTAESSMVLLEKIERQLTEVFGDRMLNTLPETQLPDDSFFDTAYHLTYPEKTRISHELAKRLREKTPVAPRANDSQNQRIEE